MEECVQGVSYVDFKGTVKLGQGLSEESEVTSVDRADKSLQQTLLRAVVVGSSGLGSRFGGFSSRLGRRRSRLDSVYGDRVKWAKNSLRRPS